MIKKNYLYYKSLFFTIIYYELQCLLFTYIHMLTLLRIMFNFYIFFFFPGNPSMNDKKKKTLVTADDSGKLKMFRWPCIEKGSPFSVESGHASHVTCVRWNSDCKWVVSTEVVMIVVYFNGN